MTYRQWEWELKCRLFAYPKEETRKIIEYYREIYGDKKEAGFSDAAILMEFGTPEECVGKIKAENPELFKDSSFLNGRELSLALKIIGIICLAVFVLIPLGSIALAVVVTLGAACIASAAVGVSGIVPVGYGVFSLITGEGITHSLSFFGLGIAAMGAGALLTVAFLLLTKYSVVAIYKCITYFVYKF